MTYTKINRIYNDINESINPDPDPGTIDLQSKSIEITENGDSVITADPNYDGLSSVNLSVNVPIPPSFTIPEYDITKFNFTSYFEKPTKYYQCFNSVASPVKRATSSTTDCCFIVQFGDNIILNHGKPPVGAYYTSTEHISSLSGNYASNGQWMKYNNNIIVNEYIRYFYDGKLINFPNKLIIFLYIY